ncbi:MAG: ComF family protein [Kangiellaceae bacterium]|nr:ComF family protein [Kangiellaceae bacterium]
MLKGITSRMLALLDHQTFFSQCYWCDRSLSFGEQFICQHCRQCLPQTSSACRRCGDKLFSHDDDVCGKCIKSPPVIENLISLYDYRFPIDAWITQYKFQRRIVLSRWFAKELAERVRCFLQDGQQLTPEAIIAVPLHRSRLKQRGFNQSRLLAQQLSQFLSIPFIEQGIIRSRFTNAQSGLSKKQRSNNLRNAFRVNCQLPKRVALVDDVITTGATINELAKQCLEAGSEHVSGWVLAHAPLRK